MSSVPSAPLTTTTNLVAGNGFVWQSVPVDVSTYGVVSLAVYCDQNTTVSVAFSADGSTWSHNTNVSVTAGLSRHIQLPIVHRYCKITSTQGAAAATTIHHVTTRLLDQIHDLMDADEDSVSAHLHSGAGVALTETGGALNVSQTALAHGTDSVTARCQDGAGNALVVAAGLLQTEDTTAAGLLTTIDATATVISSQIPVALGQAAAAASMSVVLASDQAAIPVQEVGAQNNLWNAAVLAGADTSAAVDTRYCPHLTVMGTTDAPITITPEFSFDNVTFYQDGANSFAVAGGATFAANVTCGARYIRLHSNAACTISATCAGKQ